jgi:hypothetical protein
MTELDLDVRPDIKPRILEWVILQQDHFSFGS